ncbi:DUF1318 domain-containing protein [Halieaceae bacterium IMCC14734]|uniref:DUF1318 domain-containing protein n=1 Tax=Candidatus Litorirhabdus singularis TaxID=2518993 RepID=A0ABT3TMJ6_9GAMM|nr:YdbL family protein [Candidatus Litorirhabdus singularis]MCX2982951.1 DUF1318 domain-containing protein [Candidatus Litorirhabdus singularis]
MNLIRHNLQHVLRAIALLTLLSNPAWALDLSEAKTQGMVGETHTGYIAAVEPAAKVNSLVSDINAKRKQHYQAIATQNRISLQAVEARAGLKAIEKTPSGQYINTGSGWQKK